MSSITNWVVWEQRFVHFLEQRGAPLDPAHDLSHIRRVVANARILAAAENAQGNRIKICMIVWLSGAECMGNQAINGIRITDVVDVPARPAPMSSQYRWVQQHRSAWCAGVSGKFLPILMHQTALWIYMRLPCENAHLEIVLPAAWLHDCVIIPKDSPARSHASTEAARVACGFLQQCDYPSCYHADIAHAIEAHSFSAGIAPHTTEARVVQDADRLDAVGAIGIARCMMVGGALDRALYHPDDPFATERSLDDATYTLDHFFVKLFTLADTMQTAAGYEEAHARCAYMQAFLQQLESEIRTPR